MRTKINKEISIEFIGIGNMGLPMLKNLINSDFSVVAYDINPNVTKKLEKEEGERHPLRKRTQTERGIKKTKILIKSGGK